MKNHSSLWSLYKIQYVRIFIANSFFRIGQGLTTNRSVAKFKPEQNPLCQFCKSHSETIYHLLWKCNKVKIFWNDLSHIMNNRCTNTHNFKIDENLALFGQSENIKTDKICEFIILLAKSIEVKFRTQY